MTGQLTLGHEYEIRISQNTFHRSLFAGKATMGDCYGDLFLSRGESSEPVIYGILLTEGSYELRASQVSREGEFDGSQALFTAFWRYQNPRQFSEISDFIDQLSLKSQLN